MLHQITWQQYLLFAAVFLLLYYAVIWLVYFRGQSRIFFTGEEKAGTSGDRPDWRNEDEYEELLGEPAEEEGVSTIESEQLHFSPKPVAAAQSPVPDDDEELQGLIPDVLEEIKTVIRNVNAQSGGKADFIQAFKVIPERYPQIADSRHLEAINDFIREKLPFEMAEEELFQLWL